MTVVNSPIKDFMPTLQSISSYVREAIATLHVLISINQKHIELTKAEKQLLLREVELGFEERKRDVDISRATLGALYANRDCMKRDMKKLSTLQLKIKRIVAGKTQLLDKSLLQQLERYMVDQINCMEELYKENPIFRSNYLKSAQTQRHIRMMKRFV